MEKVGAKKSQEEPRSSNMLCVFNGACFKNETKSSAFCSFIKHIRSFMRGLPNSASSLVPALEPSGSPLALAGGKL